MKHFLNTKPATCVLGTSMMPAYWGAEAGGLEAQG